jgi:hypothetical protein
MTTCCFLSRWALLTERLSYRPPQLSVEAYVRSVREEESRTQVWRPYRPSMLAATEGVYPLGMMSSGRTTLRLALSQAPEHIEGEELEKIETLGFFDPCIGF